jgi:hypothetical protein
MILSKSQLVENIVTEISDNSTGLISPHDIRHNLLDIIDSVHLLTIGKDLNANNFATPASRTTKAGEFTLEKLGFEGYFSVDNSAFGYAALKSNYQGVRNTAIGSHALNCNIYGEDNTAVGHSSLGGNTIGVGNLGLGNYTLNRNKSGNFNVAIGHGAGYYANKDESNKLYVASHQVDAQYLCDNPEGSGLIPLLYGDFSSRRIGIGVRTLTDYGALQVEGNVVPSSGEVFFVGHPVSPWRSLYLSSGIHFDNDTSITYVSPNQLSVSTSILPSATEVYSLGSSSKRWNNGYFNNLDVAGTATINRFTSVEHCKYTCKTLTLASSEGLYALDGGGPNSIEDYAYQYENVAENCSYLNDVGLSGAGFQIQSSGTEQLVVGAAITQYMRNYSFTFVPPDDSLSCVKRNYILGGTTSYVDKYDSAYWKSNISLNIESGRHLKVDRVIHHNDINILNNNCYGITTRGNKVFIAPADYSSSTSNAGTQNYNFISNDADYSDQGFVIAARESGINITQRFLTGVKNKTIDPVNLKEKLRGFEIQSIDDSNSQIQGQFTDRLVIGSYNNTSDFVNGLTIMKDSLDDGVVGITNLKPISRYILPETTLNIRSINNAVVRLTAENQANTKSAIQLLGGSNCLENGLELEYYNLSGIADLSMYKDSGKTVFARLYENNRIGIFTGSGLANEMLTIGDAYYNNVKISLHETNSDPTNLAKYTKVYVKSKPRTYQSQSIFAMDSSGNIHDLIVNKMDSLDGRGLYTDTTGNTYGGLRCTARREVKNPTTINNTCLGYYVFTSGLGFDNTIIGSYAGSGIVNGFNNTIIGSNSAKNAINNHNNIIIGHNIFNATSGNADHNIVIGNSGIGTGLNSNYNFLLGANNNLILLQGTLGPVNSAKSLSMPSGGKFSVFDSTNTDSLSFRANTIEVIDGGGNNYPDNTLSFKFTGNQSADLMTMNHSASPMTNTANYAVSIPARPYSVLNGDFRLRGAIRFSDSTSLESASFLDNITELQSGVALAQENLDYLNKSFIEGYVSQAIPAPSNPAIPSTGIMTLKDKQWGDTISVVLSNRDTTSSIHAGAYVIAIRVNNEFRPIWINAKDTACECCNK